METLLLQTDRLIIRNLQLRDLPSFHAYRSLPEVAKYQGFDTFSHDEAREFILEHTSKTFGKPGEWVQYGIELRETGVLIGDCAIRLDSHDARLGEIGISISPVEQKKGYARETMIAILRFLFSLTDFHRVTETVDAENVASINLLKSVGFREEGRFLENIFFKGKWGSEIQFAMLKREWLEKKW